MGEGHTLHRARLLAPGAASLRLRAGVRGGLAGWPLITLVQLSCLGAVVGSAFPMYSGWGLSSYFLGFDPISKNK